MKSLADHGRPLCIVYNCTSEIKTAVHHKQIKAGSTGILYKRLSAPAKEPGTSDRPSIRNLEYLSFLHSSPKKVKRY